MSDTIAAIAAAVGGAGVSYVNDVGPIDPTEPGIGDYIGVDTSYLRTHVWMDTRRGNQDIYTATASGC